MKPSTVATSAGVIPSWSRLVKRRPPSASRISMRSPKLVGTVAMRMSYSDVSVAKRKCPSCGSRRSVMSMSARILMREITSRPVARSSSPRLQRKPSIRYRTAACGGAVRGGCRSTARVDRALHDRGDELDRRLAARPQDVVAEARYTAGRPRQILRPLQHEFGLPYLAEACPTFTARPGPPPSTSEGRRAGGHARPISTMTYSLPAGAGGSYLRAKNRRNPAPRPFSSCLRWFAKPNAWAPW